MAEFLLEQMKIIYGVDVPAYGLFDEEIKCENVLYERYDNGIILSMFLVKTGLVPYVFIGYNLYEPIAVIDTTLVVVCPNKN